MESNYDSSKVIVLVTPIFKRVLFGKQIGKEQFGEMTSIVKIPLFEKVYHQVRIGEKRLYANGQVKIMYNADLEKEVQSAQEAAAKASKDAEIASAVKAGNAKTDAETTGRLLDAIKQVDPSIFVKAFDAGVLAVNNIVAAQDAIKAAEEMMQDAQNKLHAAQLLGFKTI